MEKISIEETRYKTTSKIINKTTGPREKVAHQSALPNPRRVTKLERHLWLGKVLLGMLEDTHAVDDKGREISTLVSLQQTLDNLFVVEIEVCLASIDIGNLSNEQFIFTTIDEASAFIAQKTGVLFHKMYLRAP